jgi:hypothetical protein
LTYNANVVRDRQRFCHPNTKKLLVVSDDDVDHECTSHATGVIESIVR